MKKNFIFKVIHRGVFDNIKDERVIYWDIIGRRTPHEPESEHERINAWYYLNEKSKSWIHNDSVLGRTTSYGLKHDCERDLGFWVDINWIKNALTGTGIHVAKENDVEFVSGHESYKYMYCIDYDHRNNKRKNSMDRLG